MENIIKHMIEKAEKLCKYEHDADCNIPYNVTIEHVVRSVPKGEW